MNNKFIFSEIKGNNNEFDFSINSNHVYYKIEIAIDIYLKAYYDVAIMYLDIAFVAQKLSEVSNIIKKYETVILDSYPRVILIVESEKPDEIKNKLELLSSYFSGEFLFDKDEIDIREEFVDFEDQIGYYEIIPVLPEYCDKYFANFIFSNYDWEPEVVQETMKLHPEWEFYTWKSAWSRKLGFDLYVSYYYWLLDINTDLSSALREASDYKSLTIEDDFIRPIRVFSIQNDIYFLTKDDVISTSINLHQEIIKCAKSIFIFKDIKYKNIDFNLNILANILISKDYSIIIFKTDFFQYVLFYESITILEKNEIDNIASSVQNLIADLFERSSNSIRIKCKWSLIDDEIFELICYDLILRDGRFINEETRKMGLSKSRDGGRDIVTYTKTYSGQEKKKLWIVQCKFSKSNKSLGRDDIKLSDLIDEYLPYGVIIATNMIIDAGAYDKFDKIGENRKICISYWNGLWVERLLNRNPDLIRGYELADV